MSIQGTSLSDKNVRLRFFLFVFCGIIAFGAVLYWRQATLTNADYVLFDIPRSNKNPQSGTMKSKQYQIELREDLELLNK